MGTKELKYLAISSMLSGIAYIAFSAIQIINMFGSSFIETFYRADPITPFTLMIIGLIYLNGVIGLFRGNVRSVSYPLTATILAILVGAIYSLTLLAHFIQANILNTLSNWSPLTDLTPEIFLTPIAIINLYPIIKLVRKGIIKPL